MSVEIRFVEAKQLIQVRIAGPGDDHSINAKWDNVWNDVNLSKLALFDRKGEMLRGHFGGIGRTDVILVGALQFTFPGENDATLDTIQYPVLLVFCQRLWLCKG